MAIRNKKEKSGSAPLPLVDRECLLQRFAGKGGWTYTELPEVKPATHNWFGWVRVKGSIDSHQLSQYNLMPMGNGSLFLPVKAAIRKKIGKEAGDTVHVVLYADDSPLLIPEELEACLQTEPAAHAAFLSLQEREQKACIDWIYGAKGADTRATRIVTTIERLLRGGALSPGKKPL